MLYTASMISQFHDNWTTQLRKGILEFCILNTIRGARRYGYDIVRRLRQIEGLVMSEGTIYPILSRFKREGLVQTSIEESQEGPPRKYYKLTARGQQQLERMNQYWDVIKSGIDAIRAENKS